MADGTTTTAGGNARIAATGTAGDVKLSAVSATAGSASIYAKNGSITDNTAAEAANVTAQKVRLEAKNAIGGTGGNDIETSVDNLEAKATTGVAFVHNDKAVTVGGVNGVTVKKVATADAGTADVTDDDLAGANAVASDLSILADGQMTVSEAVNAGNSAVLETTAGDIIANATVTAAQNATLLAKAGVRQNANVTATAGDAYVEAQGGDVAMADGTTTTAGGNVLVQASQGVELAAISAEGKTVAVKANGGDITDANGGAANITAANAALTASGSVGAGSDHIETTVETLAVQAGANAFATESDALTVGTVASVDVNKVNSADAAASGVASGALSGIQTAANGALTGAAVVVAGDALAVGQAVQANEIRLETTAGDITLGAAVTGSDNVTIVSKGATTANAAVMATAGDLYIDAGGKIDINAGATAGNTMALVSGASIEADALSAKTLYTSAKGDINPGEVEADKAAFSTDGDLTLALKKDSTLGISAGGDITINANGYSVKAGPIAEDGAAGISVNEVPRTGEVQAKTLEETTTAGGAADGIVSKGGDVDVNDAKNIGGSTIAANKGNVAAHASGDYTVSNTSAGGDLTLDVGGSTQVNSLEAGRDLTLDTGKALSASSVKVGGTADLAVGGNASVDTLTAGTLEADVGGSFNSKKLVDVKKDATLGVKGDVTLAEINVGGDLTIAGQGGSGASGNLEFETMTAKSVEATTGSIAMGKVSATDATFDAKGSITDNGSEVATKNLTMKASGDIGTSSAPIVTKTQGGVLKEVTGRNVYLEETATGTVGVGKIAATGGDLELHAPNLGETGRLAPAGAGTGKISATGDMTLDVAGHLGKVSADGSGHIELDVGGKLNLRSGSLAGKGSRGEGLAVVDNEGYVYVVAKADRDKVYDIWNGYKGNTSGQKVPGLVIINGQVLDGNPDLIRKIHRAEAFTVETPELKSKQGVFGSPVFVHTDMDVNEAASIGSVDYLRLDTLRFQPVVDDEVNATLLDDWEYGNGDYVLSSFESGLSDVTKFDEIYTRTAKPETEEQKARKAKEKAEREAAKAEAAKTKAEKAEAKKQAKLAEKAAKAKQREEAAKAKAEAKAAREAEAKAKAEAAAKAKAEAKAAREAEAKAKAETKAGK